MSGATFQPEGTHEGDRILFRPGAALVAAREDDEDDEEHSTDGNRRDDTATRQAPGLFLPGVSFAVTIHAAPAEQVTSYAVEEQVPWDDVLIAPNVAGRMEFYDPAAPISRQRLYRARTTL